MRSASSTTNVLRERPDVAGKKLWYEVETRDREGPVGRYVAALTDRQAAEVKALLDRAVAEGLFPYYLFGPFPKIQAHVQALNVEALVMGIRDDMEIAAKTRRSPEMGAAKRRMTAEQLERELHRYLSRHHRPREGEEAYDFDIKIRRRVHVPESVRHAKGWSESELGDFIEQVMVDRLKEFAEELKRKYDWIGDWFQEGRSGGWLVLVTREPVGDEYGRLTVEDRHAVEKRLRDLDEISELVDLGIRELVGHLESRNWWGLSPKDWSPRER